MLIYQMFQYLRAEALFGKQIRRADGWGNSGDLQVQHVEHLRDFWMFFFGLWPAEVFAFDVIISSTLLSHQLMMYLFQLTFLLNILRCLVWMCCLNHQTMLRVLQTKWARRLRSLRKFRSERIPSAKPNGIPAFGPVGILNTGPIDWENGGKRYFERMNLNTSMNHDEPLIEVIATTWQGGGDSLQKKNICTKNHEEKNSCTCVFSPGPSALRTLFLARPGSRT